MKKIYLFLENSTRCIDVYLNSERVYLQADMKNLAPYYLLQIDEKVNNLIEIRKAHMVSIRPYSTLNFLGLLGSKIFHTRVDDHGDPLNVNNFLSNASEFYVIFNVGAESECDGTVTISLPTYGDKHIRIQGCENCTCEIAEEKIEIDETSEKAGNIIFGICGFVAMLYIVYGLYLGFSNGNIFVSVLFIIVLLLVAGICILTYKKL